MEKPEWDLLCKSIRSKKCILIIGPELPIRGIQFPILDEKNPGQELTTISKQVARLIANHLKSDQEIPNDLLKELNKKELHQITADYIKLYPLKKNKIFSDGRAALSHLITDFFDKYHTKLESAIFKELITDLPFSFIVDTNYTSFLADELSEVGKTPTKEFYNYKGRGEQKIIDLEEHEAHPFIYNLFGTTEEPKSVVYTENDLIEFVVNLIRLDPGLPKDVKSALSDPERDFLFIGFGMMARNWYFRVLLHALESNKKDNLSFAIDNLTGIDPENNILIFFREELKMRLVHQTIEEFITKLVSEYTTLPHDGFNKLKVFISHKSEDFKRAKEVHDRLRDVHGMEPWIDREHTNGNYRNTLTQKINEADAFVLVQSKELVKSPKNFVYSEIKDAIEASKLYNPPEFFLYPGIIDGYEYRLKIPSEIEAIDPYDLSTDEGIDKMAKEIKRNYERLAKQ